MKEICTVCNAILIDGVCPTCSFYADLNRQIYEKNEHLPITWRIQILKKITRKRIYQVRKVQGSYQHENHKVYLTWSTRPTENPQQHDYINEKWSCNCGKSDCEHIKRVQNWRGIKKQNGQDITPTGICLGCGEALVINKDLVKRLLKHTAKDRNGNIETWGCQYCGDKRHFLLPAPMYSPAFEYVEALGKYLAQKKPKNLMRFVKAKKWVEAVAKGKFVLENW
jgi:hypothetical protein